MRTAKQEHYFQKCTGYDGPDGNSGCCYRDCWRTQAGIDLKTVRPNYTRALMRFSAGGRNWKNPVSWKTRNETTLEGEFVWKSSATGLGYILFSENRDCGISSQIFHQWRTGGRSAGDLSVGCKKKRPYAVIELKGPTVDLDRIASTDARPYSNAGIICTRYRIAHGG